MTTRSAREAAALHLRSLRTSRGLSQAAVAHRLNTHQSTLTRLESGATRITWDWAVRLAAVYDLAPEDVLPTGTAMKGHPLPAREPALGRAGDPAARPTPIYATAAQPDGQFLLTGPVDSYAKKYQALYGIYMMDDSMSPRYEIGWLLLVSPHKPAAAGRDVVVRTTAGHVLVRTLVTRRSGLLELRSLAPGEHNPIQLPETDVASVHLVVGCHQDA